MSGDVAALAAEMTPYLSAALGAYGGAVLVKVRDEAADATVGLGRRLLLRIFGSRKDGEPLPESLRAVAANPEDSDAQAALRLAIRKTLAADPALESQIRAMLAGASSVTQKIHAGGNVNVSGRDQIVINNLVNNVKGAMAPGLLPRDIPNFTGREDELAELTYMAGLESLKIVVINGTAGVGKTALAVHAAHLLLEQFLDGQLYADMHGYTDGQKPAKPSEVLVTFLRRLGVENPEMPVAIEEQSGLMRNLLASKRMVVLLDNVANEAQVDPLLPGAGASLVLITSRTPLIALDVDRRIDLDVLSHEQAITLLESIIGQGRTRADPGATTQVSDWCGCLPLALRIAGQLLAVHKTWPVSRLASMLADEQQRLDRLAVGDLQIRTAFQVSYRQLADADALVFGVLGLHQGSAISVTLAAGLAGINVQEAETILERLSMAHLVIEDEPGQFVMHDLIRLFARETCRRITSGSRGALKLPTPVARLYGMAMNSGIEVVTSDYESWPDDEFAALVSFDGIVFLNPSIEDDDLLADILAFVTAVCSAIVVGDTAPDGFVAAPHGVVMIGRERLPEPPKGPGRLARMFAQQCGRDTASATFSIFPLPFELGT